MAGKQRQINTASTKLICNQLQMSGVKKYRKIKKNFPAQSHSQSQQSVQKQQPSKDPAQLAEEHLLESLLPDVPMKRPLKCDPRQISNLPEQERKKIRAQHPEMSQYFFMTSRDKTKYFHLLNFQFRQKVKPTEPPGSAPKKKTITFKKRFQILSFRQSERCDQLKKRKPYTKQYVASRQGKPRQLTKTPKVS